LNPYAYGLANPFSTPDITGLCAFELSLDNAQDCGGEVGGFVAGQAEEKFNDLKETAGSFFTECQFPGQAGCLYLAAQATRSMSQGNWAGLANYGWSIIEGSTIGLVTRYSTVGTLFNRYSNASDAVRSAASPILRSTPRIFKHLKPFAKKLPFVGGGITLVGNLATMKMDEALVRSVANIAGSAAGATIGTMVCGTATVATAGAGVAICAVSITGGAVIAGTLVELAAAGIHSKIE